MEVVLDSGASFEVELKVGEYSVDEVLVGGPEEGSDFRGVFRLFDSGVFVGILGVGVVGVSPLELPPQVVRVAVVVADLIILYRVQQAFDWRACGQHFNPTL